MDVVDVVVTVPCVVEVVEAPVVGVEASVGLTNAVPLAVAVCANAACIPWSENEETMGTANAVPTTILFRNARRSSPTRPRMSSELLIGFPS
jgi:hypothetical protein